VWLLGAGPALAQTPRDKDERREAARHFEQGEAFFKAHEFDKAALEYQAAYDLIPEPSLLFNIGLSFENDGSLEKANDHYRRYLSASPQGAKAPEARARSEAISRKLAEARLAEQHLAEAARRRTLAAERIAQGRFEEALIDLRAAETLSSDPDILFEIAEAERLKGDLDAATADYLRYLGVKQATRHRLQAAARIDEIQERRSPPPSFMPGLYVAGGAAFLVGIGTFFGLQANRIKRDLDRDLAAGTPPLDSQDPRFDEGRTAALRSTVFFALAGGALAASAILTTRAFWLGRKRTKVSIEPHGDGRAVGIGVEASW
jgi:tetratricopeptide (TPR) repeat protein